MKRLLAVLLLGVAAAAAQTAAPFDLILAGGSVIDGSGAPARIADVGVRDGRIAAIGNLSRAAARERVDVAGLSVAPGFIDVHTHADNIASRPAAGNFVRMGVTTVVAGNCGSSPVDVANALDEIRAARVAVNFATLVGHNSVRSAVMGSVRRDPTLPELERMKGLVFKAMADGAVGLSTGLQYVPGTYASTPEIIELARVAANAGGLYTSHMRNEGTALEAAIRETLQVGRMSGARVQISHLKVDARSRWGASRDALAMIDAARAAGQDVRADQYAYTAAGSGLGIRFPSWALEGGREKIRERLNDAATWARIKKEMLGLVQERGFEDLSWATVASYQADPSLNGLSMADVAQRLHGARTADAQFEAARTLMLGGAPSMVYHFMDEGDVERIMRHPSVSVAADSGVLEPNGTTRPHPRGYGNNARVLARYVRERKIIPVEEAIRKMTSLPADHFRLTGRGRLAAGAAADIVVFDPARVRDVATFDAPHGYAEGIPHVLVNGMFVVRNGAQTAERPGAVLAPSLLKVR
ncbi:MAG: D-aminoacylase [Vicinamibacterales bacterium]